MSDQEVSDFMSISGCSDTARAKFFLDAAGGDVQAALANFFDNGGNEAPIVIPDHVEEPVQQAPRLTGVSVQQGISPEDHREFSVGGEKSGLAVMKKETENNDEFVTGLFKRAQENAGATADDPNAVTDRFSGGGHRLGGEGMASQHIPKKEVKKPETVKLTMWKDGFTINEEPIRLYSDAKNKEFLDQITSGKLPMELVRFGSEVALEMEDRRQEDYEENQPKPTFKSFGGAGSRLGGTSSSGPPVPAPPAPARELLITVDPSKPKTKLRLRLASGKQLVQEFNQDHTITDLKSFCDVHAGGRTYELRSGFPPKPLDLTSSSTLLEAKLLNETIIQRLL